MAADKTEELSVHRAADNAEAQAKLLSSEVRSELGPAARMFCDPCFGRADWLGGRGSRFSIKPGVDGHVEPGHESTVRVRVVVWDVSELSLVKGSFFAKFRVTLFWRPTSEVSSVPISSMASAEWEMPNRSEALFSGPGDLSLREAVPPIAVLNVKEFTVEGKGPEVHLIEPTSGRRLMRWTCMYVARMTQPALHQSRRRGGLVSFPYDSHRIAIELGVQFG